MENRPYLKKLETIFNDWKETIPEDIFEVFIKDVNSFSEEDIADFFQKFEKTGSDWGFWPVSSFVSDLLSKTIREITKSISLEGIENAENVFAKLQKGEVSKVMIITNHVSYSDANILATYLRPSLEKFGFKNDFSVVAGPKVFNTKFKKFSSLHFNSLLIAQSLAVATKEASLSPREVAKAALKVASDIKDKVKILLVFPEGGRSRDFKLMRFLPGVLRLLDVDENVAILPGSVIGGEVLLPINSSKLYHADIKIKIGAHIMLRDIKKMFDNDSHQKQSIMDFIGKRVAELLPEERQGVYSKNGD